MKVRDLLCLLFGVAFLSGGGGGGVQTALGLCTKQHFNSALKTQLTTVFPFSHFLFICAATVVVQQQSHGADLWLWDASAHLSLSHTRLWDPRLSEGRDLL